MVEASHDGLGRYELHCENADALLFTENESNLERLWGVPNRSPFVKDSINDAVTQNKIERVNPEKVGTKAAAHYHFLIAPAETRFDSLAPAQNRQSSLTRRLRRPRLPNPLFCPHWRFAAVSHTGERVRATRLFDDFDEIFGRRAKRSRRIL